MMLQRYAERRLGATSSHWVRRHLASCHDCRTSLSFARSLGEALKSLPSMTPLDNALIERVLEERRAGHRAVLPTGNLALPTRAWRKGLILAAAAAAAVILATSLVSRSRSTRTTDRSASSSRVVTQKSPPTSTEEFAVSEFFLPRSAFATEIDRSDSLFPPLTLDGGRLKSGVVKYIRFERVGDGARRRIGSESVELSATRIEGRDAWRVVQRRQIADTEHVETLYADRATLRALGRTIRVRPYMHYVGITGRQRLIGDSLTGWMQTDSGLGRPIARHLSPAPAPYLSDALAPVLLGATTLDGRWRGSFSILGWAVRDGDVSFPARLRVIGQERVTVPAGTFECWKVAVEASVGMQTYWVRKTDGVGVRALLERDGLSREIVLTR
jgi:hypothetical protein